MEEFNSDTDNGDDSDYVEDNINRNDSESTPEARNRTSSKLEVYSGINSAIVLRRCQVHNRYARLNCMFMHDDSPCEEVICDMCLYSRKMCFSKYPSLQNISHLVCNNHFANEKSKAQRYKNLSKIVVEGEMDVDAELLDAQLCPYCTSNDIPKVFNICVNLFCVFTHFCYAYYSFTQICSPKMCIYTIILFLIFINSIQAQSSLYDFPHSNNDNSVSSSKAVFNRIQNSLNRLCDISSHLPKLNNKTPFLGNNAFIKGVIGLLIHSIVLESEKREIKWCTAKFYDIDSRKLEYNALKDMVLTDVKLDHVRTMISEQKRSQMDVMEHTHLANWCSNTRRKMTAGTWTDQSDYDSTKIYDAHRHFILKMGFLLKSE